MPRRVLRSAYTQIVGTTFKAFIQIDDNTAKDQPPFSNDPSTWDLTRDIGLSEGKDYEFYAAIAGPAPHAHWARVLQEKGKGALYDWRGIPPAHHLDPITILAGDHNVSWLNLSEVRVALEHLGIGLEDLASSIQLVLRAMAEAEQLFGKDRVRLVFQLSS